MITLKASKTTKWLMGIFALFIVVGGALYFFTTRGADTPEPLSAFSQPTASRSAIAMAADESLVTLPEVYAQKYEPKHRCRFEYQLTGLMLITQELGPHSHEVEQLAGTPSGTTIKEVSVVDIDPWPVNTKIVSNKPLSLAEALATITPPKGWIKGAWSDDPRYNPRMRIIYQNCYASIDQPVSKD